MYSKVKNTFIFLLGKHNARNAAIVTTTLTLASRLFSYVKILLIAYFFGASAFVDAYYIAYGAIFFITGTMQGTLESAVLPKLVQNDKETAENIMGWVVHRSVILCLIVSAIIIAFPEQFIKIFARSFDQQRITYAADLIKWILPGALSLLFVGILTMWANYKERFAVSNTITVFSNILAIPTLVLLYPLIENYALPAYQSIVYFVLAICMWRILKGVPMTCHGRLPSKLMSKINSDILLCLISGGAGFIYTLIDRYFASSLPTGNVSAITYAQMIFSQPIGFMGAAMSVYLVRASSAAKTTGDVEGQLYTALYIAWSYFFPASILLSVLAEPTVKVLLGYGAFDARAIALTVPCLSVMALGLPIMVWLTIIGRYAQATGKLRLLAVWSYIGVGGNFFLDWLFVDPYGAPGLCAATAIMWGVSTVFLMMMLVPKITWRLCRSLILQTIIVLAWGLILLTLRGENTYLSLFIGGIVGLVHIFLCDRIGLFDSIPRQWRPTAIGSLFLHKIIQPRKNT